MGEGLYVGTNVGNYSLKKLLGVGSYGEVYLAEHRGNGRHVAIKLMTNPPLKQTGFLEEARNLFIVRHKRFVLVADREGEL